MSGWTCASCGKQSPEGTRFCGHCGTPAAEAPAPATWSCRMCGTANPESNAFCGGCGERAQTVRTEELRLVTALFADISGFTTLADSLDIESLHEIITPLVAGLSRIAERYGGFIEKFAGDALLVVYGAPVTHEDDAQRALLAALDMHAELPRLLAELGPSAAHLTIHVGVNTGRVIGHQAGSEQQSDYAVLGDSVILAQRLESVCPSGETYVGPTTYALCKEEFEFESVGELTLKGKLAAVEAFRLIGPKRQPSPQALRPLVGRERELQQIDAALTLSAAGEGAVVVLSGEAGSGKTRLLTETTNRASARDMTVLSMRCLSYGASLPYWPFSDLLRRTVGELPGSTSTDARLREHFPPGSLPGMRRLLADVDDGVDPQQARREVHDGVVGWLAELAAREPLVLVVEDVHWLDAASAALLGELLHVARRLPILVLVTTRPEGLSTVDTFVADAAATRVELAALADESVVELTRSVIGGTPSRALMHLLSTKTSGNPLFVEELLASLREADLLVETEHGWDVLPTWEAAGVPETLERVFAARLDALPTPAAGLLQVMSVIGRTVPLPLLSAVAAVDSTDLGPLEFLLSAGLLHGSSGGEADAVTFHHALLQDAVYARLLRKRRRDLHRRVADAARRLYGDGDDTIELLARHLYLAEAGDDAVPALLRAGRRAARLFANDAAVLHFTRALELKPDSEEVVLLLADVLLLLGRYADVLEVSASAASVDDRLAVVRAAALTGLAEYDEALRVLDPHLADQEEPNLRVLLERARVAFAAGRPVEALDAVRAGLRVQGSDERARADLLLELVRNETDAGHPEFAVSHGARAAAAFERLGDLRSLSVVLRIVGDAQRKLGNWEQAAAALERAGELAGRTGAVEEQAACLLNLAIVQKSQGDLDGAVGAATRALRIAQRLRHRSGQAACLVNLADFQLTAGDLDEAAGTCEAALRLTVETGNVRQQAMAVTTRAQIHLARGELDLATSSANEGRRLALQVGLAEAVLLADGVLAAACPG